jgi:hypothetical protein
MRNDSSSWGGGYVEVLYSYNDSPTWQSLGVSGYDGAVMHNGASSIATYSNEFVLDFSAETSAANLRFKFRHRSYDGTLTINASHDISGGAGFPDGLSYAWSHVIATLLGPSCGPRGPQGDPGTITAYGTSGNFNVIGTLTAEGQRVPKITVSTSLPSGGSNGDVWIRI